MRLFAKTSLPAISPTAVQLTQTSKWLLLHHLHPGRIARSTKMTPKEKQPRWEITTKCCAGVVFTSALLHKGRAPAMLHLPGLTFRLCGGRWQSCGSDRSAPPFHTTHVEIILVRQSFLSPGQQLNGPEAFTCTSSKTTRLLLTCQSWHLGQFPMRFQQALCGNVGHDAYYFLHQPSNALFLDT